MDDKKMIDLLANASTEELLNQLRWSFTAMVSSKLVETREQGRESYELVVAEIKRRLEK